MAQIHKADRSLVIKAPVAQMHDMWSTKLSLMHTICPVLSHFKASWEARAVSSSGNSFTGKLMVAKNVMEVVDKENDRIVLKVIEGGPLELYKSCKCIYQACPINNVVTWTFEYEKDTEDVPEPEAFLDLTMAMMKQIDAHLTRA